MWLCPSARLLCVRRNCPSSAAYFNIQRCLTNHTRWHIEWQIWCDAYRWNTTDRKWRRLLSLWECWARRTFRFSLRTTSSHSWNWTSDINRKYCISVWQRHAWNVISARMTHGNSPYFRDPAIQHNVTRRSGCRLALLGFLRHVRHHNICINQQMHWHKWYCLFQSISECQTLLETRNCTNLKPRSSHDDSNQRQNSDYVK